MIKRIKYQKLEHKLDNGVYVESVRNEEKPLAAQCWSKVKNKENRLEAVNTGYNTKTYEDT